MPFLLDIGAVDAAQSAKQILDQGIVGAVCILLIITVVFLARALMKSHTDRINDLKTYASKIKESSDAMYELIVETNKATAHATSEVMLSNREVLAKVTDHGNKIDTLSRDITQLKDQQVRLEVAASRGSR